MKLTHFVLGEWLEGKGKETSLLDASNSAAIATAMGCPVEFSEVLNYARTVGSPKLRALTFHQRALKLKELALYLMERKEKFYEISYATGATRADSWIDIEGGCGNLFTYAGKGRRELPNDVLIPDGKHEVLAKSGNFLGHHVWTSKRGVAIHINAFNFPVWGMLEKIAVNWLAGVPAIVKPATATSYLTHAVAKEIIASKIFPEGALQLICGPADGILDHVGMQDIVTFTGSAHTGKKLKSHPRILEHSVCFNMEADSLNCSILGPDAAPGTPEFDLFIKEVAREMTTKAGQKCTAIRRTIVPRKHAEAVGLALKERLAKTVIGDPRQEGVRMGPLASLSQLKEVQAKITELRRSCDLVYGPEDFAIVGGDKNKGAFMAPTLMYCDKPLKNNGVHDIEAFGPVSTIIPYDNADEAIELANLGLGSLVGSVVTHDRNFARDVVIGCGPYHGRLLFLDRDCAKDSTGHGSPMPQLVHGGPGRAGGGEEMGGIRGIYHYMQRTAIQGHPTTLTKITGVYQPGAEQTEHEKHPFRKYFEELAVGDTLVTHKRTVTEADIVNFGNLSWDHFYAHTDETSLDGTLFEKRVAHGYFVISAAAGLFVDPGKGPVLANYGLDELRFIKPVYVGATIGVRLTVKEKIAQAPRPDELPRGIVKWQVDVYDEQGETVALATILTLVQRKEA
jgi:oxepin-CoA hydrolase/3-oxo-5,6-dehydrosuberyl-CoA semialdehyde dehydrogenase